MDLNLNEVMPWGLTQLQSGLVGCGCLALLGGWLLLQYIIKMTRLIFTVGLMTVIGLACCGAGVFYMMNP